MNDMSDTGTPHASTLNQGRVRRVPLTQIIGGDREVQIDHDGQIYRLRVTSKGKLILTK
ncbi:MAG: hemin uptake protein HemP [Rhodospirillales bacterium]